jgi:hypothetical protein
MLMRLFVASYKNINFQLEIFIELLDFFLICVTLTVKSMSSEKCLGTTMLVLNINSRLSLINFVIESRLVERILKLLSSVDQSRRKSMFSFSSLYKSISSEVLHSRISLINVSKLSICLLSL